MHEEENLTMRYYVYVSDTKVDMLLPQVPQKNHDGDSSRMEDRRKDLQRELILWASTNGTSNTAT
jgi:hypothetical protein